MVQSLERLIAPCSQSTPEGYKQAPLCANRELSPGFIVPLETTTESSQRVGIYTPFVRYTNVYKKRHIFLKYILFSLSMKICSGTPDRWLNT